MEGLLHPPRNPATHTRACAPSSARTAPPRLHCEGDRGGLVGLVKRAFAMLRAARGLLRSTPLVQSAYGRFGEQAVASTTYSVRIPGPHWRIDSAALDAGMGKSILNDHPLGGWARGYQRAVPFEECYRGDFGGI